VTNALDVVGVSRSFGAVQALDDCNVSVAPGSITALIGPNGCGKTTLFNCITGLLRPDSGEILFNGRSILRQAPHAIARAGIGRTFQSTRIFRKLTVAQNLEAASTLSGRHSVAGGREFLQLFDIDRFHSTPAGDLSYGQQKLVELAAVMTTDPTAILLDEPASGVSKAFLGKLSDYIQQLRRPDRAILVVEHNMEFVFGLCERVIVMDGGKKIAEGSGAEIQQNVQVLQAYLGVPDVS
jgi:branched-chain amino acid transport system ATP-binding protein/branched-chain amino acid transport system permease protein